MYDLVCFVAVVAIFSLSFYFVVWILIGYYLVKYHHYEDGRSILLTERDEFDCCSAKREKNSATCINDLVVNEASE